MTFQFLRRELRLAPQTVTVSANGNPVTASVQTLSGGNWLNAAVSQGTATSVVTVSSQLGTCGVGTYAGTVTISSPGLPSANVSVNVTVIGLPSRPAHRDAVTALTDRSGGNEHIRSIEHPRRPVESPVAYTALPRLHSDGGNWLAAGPGLAPDALYSGGQRSATGRAGRVSRQHQHRLGKW